MKSALLRNVVVMAMLRPNDALMAMATPKRGPFDDDDDDDDVRPIGDPDDDDDDDDDEEDEEDDEEPMQLRAGS